MKCNLIAIKIKTSPRPLLVLPVGLLVGKAKINFNTGTASQTNTEGVNKDAGITTITY